MNHTHISKNKMKKETENKYKNGRPIFQSYQ